MMRRLEMAGGTVFQADNANADNVCLLLSSTGQTSGVVMYVQK